MLLRPPKPFASISLPPSRISEMKQRRSSSSSFFRDLPARELNGTGAVFGRPYLGDLSSDSGGIGSGVLVIDHEEFGALPLAISFSKSSKNPHFLAVSDEDGYIGFYDTRRRLPSLATCGEKTAEAKLCGWDAHNNAIFDISWIRDDTQVLTASGDQMIKIWNLEAKKCIGVLGGHTGSVKSLSSHPSNPDLVVSGSRDGSFALWDLRCKPGHMDRDSVKANFVSVAVVKGAHMIPRRQSSKRGKVASTSITSVLCLKDEIIIATAGATDSVVKFWDTRNLKASCGYACPCTTASVVAKNPKLRRPHGISSLSQDSNGVHLAASCMDNKIYLYNTLHFDKGPMKTFTGSRIESFFVKSVISADGFHILGGSSDGNAYIWQVKKPEKAPIVLKGHEGEVSAVDWCLSEVGKFATSADDFMVRVWNMQQSSCVSTGSPTFIRKRVTAEPSIGGRKLFMDEPSAGSREEAHDICQSRPTMANPPSPAQQKELEFTTPESGRKRNLNTFLMEAQQMQKSPETLTSPSSVLSPPPSVKRRTILDYFLHTP